MAIKIEFDSSYNPIPPVIVLATKSGKRLGALPAKDILLKDCMNDVANISFSVNKEDFIRTNRVELWNQIVDFKTIWVKEWNSFFEITVNLNDSTKIEKVITATSLGQAELSQINVYNTEINSADDIDRDDYVPSILYNVDNPEASILHRLLRKAPHYRISHVDKSIANIQRTFSFDKKSIKDCFDEIATEINCLIIYNCYFDTDGNMVREISAYDLEDYCNKCGQRGTFHNGCTKCGSSDVIRGYGKDTSIFVSSRNLADEITLTNDTGSVKNCFKLQAGDDLMTATVAGCNPDGSDYIWFISDHQRAEMSKELATKLDAYDSMYNYFQNDYQLIMPQQSVTEYNSIVDRYSLFSDSIKKVAGTIIGYPAMMNGYYNTIDLIMFLRHSLMPNIKVDETDAKTEANKLTQKALVGTAVLDIEKLSLTTASNAVLAMAKIVANSSKYQIRIKEASLVGKVWTGSFTLKSYSDEDDTADSQTVSVVISDSYEKYVRQKIDTVLAKASDDIIDLVALFKTEEGDFSSEIKKYSLSMLNSFHESCQAALNILIEQGVSDEGTMAFNNNVYKKLYAPMRIKCSLIEDEIKQREFEISIVEKIQGILENQRSYIQSQLNMENYLGRILWTELMSYRREDIYQNDNYISDGLDNAELIERALEFIDVAKKEIFKSATSQYSITAEMKNLLVMKEFQPIVNSFETGNWIRVSVDNTVYKLRLIEYQIDFSNIPVVSVVFSDVNTTTDGISDIKSILRQASSMASSYESVARQASQGAKGSQNIDKIIQDGISASDTEIVDDKKRQSQTWGKNGMLFREYDQVQERYYDEQMRIINSTIAITDNNWKTTKTAIGKFFYLDPVTKELRQVWGVNGELIAGRLLLGESLGIYNMAGTLSFDNEGLVVKNENNTVSINPNSKQIFDIANKQGSLITFNDSGDLVIIGDITAKSLTLSDGVSIDSDKIDGLALVSLSGDYSDLNNLPDLSGIEKNAEDIRANTDEIKSNTDSIAELQSKANSTDEIINSLMSKVEELQRELESLNGGSTGESTGGTV